MRTGRFEMPVGTFRAIARGGGGRAAVRRLLAVPVSRNLLALRSAVMLATDLGHPHAPLVNHAWELLGELRRSAPAPTRAVLGYPTVSVWAAGTLRALGHGDRGSVDDPATLGAVVAAVALRAGARARVSFPTSPSGAVAVTLPGLGLVHRGPGGGAGLAELTVDGARGTLTLDGVPVTGPGPCPRATGGGPAPVWHPVPRLRAHGHGPRLHLDDLWSLAHPAAVAPVDATRAARWATRLSPGWRLLAIRHRRAAAELTEAISMVMPLARDAAGRPWAAVASGGTPDELTAPLISGTFPVAVGCVALSDGPGAAGPIAAALVHELAHNKLAALDHLFPLVEAAEPARHPAPWRAGARPLPALVQGLYAHVAVGEFWRRERHFGTTTGRHLAHAEFARLRGACREVTDLLRTADGLTGCGRLLVDQLDDVVDGWSGRRAGPTVTGRTGRRRLPRPAPPVSP
ncbi:aKG-HExxH-type peptide beta-hydroxylase [Micromonospora schwarzwaldensis]|uniref:aKG-HExxH-type peptide beta-hydroxylase n=1 Tax=Micromonospora sp. DSM 45708 TaxID=3111767 RepID=UPI0031D2DFB2